MIPTKLSDDMIRSRLKEIPGWEFRNGKLHREFKFESFEAAFRFMTDSAEKINELDHHPEWANLYNWVRVDLNTHLVQGISERDFALAHAMNEVAHAVTHHHT